MAADKPRPLLQNSLVHTYLALLETEKFIYRAVARSENPGGLVVMGGDNVPTLVEIGWIDLPKTGGAKAPPALPACHGPVW